MWGRRGRIPRRRNRMRGWYEAGDSAPLEPFTWKSEQAVVADSTRHWYVFAFRQCTLIRALVLTRSFTV